MVKAFAVWAITVVFAVLEVLVAQWLFGIFGFHFGFWTVFFILLAIEFLAGLLFGSRK